MDTPNYNDLRTMIDNTTNNTPVFAEDIGHDGYEIITEANREIITLKHEGRVFSAGIMPDTGMGPSYSWGHDEGGMDHGVTESVWEVCDALIKWAYKMTRLP